MSEATAPPAGPKKLRLHRSSSLQRRFLLGIGIIFLAFALVISLVLYTREKSLLEKAAHEKTEMVLAAEEATRAYIQDILRPTMYQVMGRDAFVLEAMSTSYVSRAVMDRLKGSLPEYQIRRVAQHARNPHSEPKPFEIKLIQFFAANPNLTSWHGIIKVGGQSSFVHARPVVFTASCMHCHGNPADAPPALLKLYGHTRGFGHQPGDIAGVTAVSIPVDVALAKIQQRAASIFGLSLLGLSLLYMGVVVFFNRVVVHSLRDLLEVFRHGLRDEKELALLTEAKAKDEIGELTTAAQLMVGQLHDTRQQLEEYAGNLEDMVHQRTQALEESQQQLQEKITTRNQELHTLNTIAELITRSVNLADILPRVLVQTLKLIPARGAAVYLLRDNPTRLELQYQENADRLLTAMPLGPEEYQDCQEENATDLPSSLLQALGGRMSFFACAEEQNCLNVPLVCRHKVLGVMTFVQVDFDEISPEQRELLNSVGQQIGITIESLQNVENLVHSKDLLQSVFDGITDLMVLLDRDLRIKMVNQAYLRHYGVTLTEVLNQPWGATPVDGHCPFSPASLEKVFRAKTPMTEEVQSSTGEIFRVNYYPILNERGEMVSIVRARDITVEKRVEQRIQNAERLASLGQLAGGLAHEINNPLGVILCYADLLKSQLADFPQGFKDVAIIEKHAVNCQRIVADLLQFARGQETARQPSALNDAVEEVVRMVDPQFRRQRCAIEMELAADLPLVNIDVNKMKQVYLNLLMNARQAIKGRGAIHIQSSYLREARQVRLTFQDNGSGIPPGIIGRIFDPFFSTKKTGEGTGLGLSVSYGIIKEHGGDIQVESEPGQGTRFTIELPVEETH